MKLSSYLIATIKMSGQSHDPNQYHSEGEAKPHTDICGSHCAMLSIRVHGITSETSISFKYNTLSQSQRFLDSEPTSFCHVMTLRITGLMDVII
jgi:hypothetical protein